MLIDVSVVNKISLNINPEEYKIYYQIGKEDLQHVDLIQSVLGQLLTIKVDPKKPLFYETSIFDLKIFRRKMKEANINIIYNFTPRAKDIYKKFIDQLTSLRQIKDGSYNERIKSTLKTTPYIDQFSAAAFLLTRSKAANCCSVGIGKSLSALLCFNILKNERKVSNGIIFCMNQNKDTWERQIKQHTNYTYKIVRNGTDLVEEDINNFDHDLLVVHHNALIKEPVRWAIISRNFNFHIFDEAHILRNLDSQQTKSYFDIYEKSKPKWFIPLTGTPLPEKPMNAYSLLKLMSPDNIPSKTTFDNHFCNFFTIKKKIKLKKGKGFFIKQVQILNSKTPYKNLDELAEYMEMFTYRKTHETVVGFPPTLLSIKSIELSNQSKLIYNAIVDQTYADVAAMPDKMLKLDDVMSRTIRLRQFLSNPLLIGENIQSEKCEFMDTLLDEILDDEKQKVVIFSSFVETLKFYYDRYKTKYGTTLFKGVGDGYTKQDQTLNEKLFIENPEYRVMVANTSIAVGSNWGCSRYAIFNDLPIPRLQYTQAVGRITRRDAKGTSNIILLSAKDTFDETIREQHSKKDKIINNLIGKDQEVEIVNKTELLKGLTKLAIN